MSRSGIWLRRVGNVRRGALDRRIRRIDHERFARGYRRAFFGDLLVPLLEVFRLVVAGVDLARNLGIADRGRRQIRLLVECLRLAAPQPHRRPRPPGDPQEGRAQDAEDQRQVGAVHAQRRRHGNEGQRRAARFDQAERAAARMGQHQFAKATDQRQADQTARPSMGCGGPDVAQSDAGHAHHQQRQQQQREAQAEEAEMMGAHHTDAPGDEGDRRQDDGQPEGLQQQVGDIGAGQAQQIVGRPRRGMVERRIAGTVGEQRHHQRQAERCRGHAHDLHHAAAQEIAPAFRQDRRSGLHR